METIKIRTGVDATCPGQDAYIKDHWFAKTWAKLGSIKDGKLVVDLLTESNFDWNNAYIKSIDDELVVSKDAFKAGHPITSNPKTHVSRMVGSTWMQGVGVGAMHKLASYISNMRNIFTVGTTTDFTDCSYVDCDIDLPVWELYEGGTLGGLSWSAYRVVQALYKALTDPQAAEELTSGDLKALAENMSDASLNAKFADEFWVASTDVCVGQRTLNSTFELSLREDGSYRLMNLGNGYQVATLTELQKVQLASMLVFNLAGNRASFRTIRNNGAVAVVNGYTAVALALFQDGICERYLDSVTLGMLNEWFISCLPTVTNELHEAFVSKAECSLDHMVEGCVDVSALYNA